mgnify:CR=1 FL=1
MFCFIPLVLGFVAGKSCCDRDFKFDCDCRNRRHCRF